MRELILLLAFFLCELVNAATPFPMEYDGSMMPIHLANTTDFCRPDSLQPVFAAHVGRHGARFMTSAKKVEEPLAFLKSADHLTAKGRDFIKVLTQVNDATAGRWGQLDSLGRAEQMHLARHLFNNVSPLLEKGNINVWSSYVPRVVASAYSFCHELTLCSDKLNINISSGPNTDSLTRFFQVNKDFIHYLNSGPWKAHYTAFLNENVPLRPARALIKDISDENARKLTMQMYAVLSSMNAISLPSPAADFFTEQEWKQCWEVANLRHYLERTQNPYGNIPASAAAPLLSAIIYQIDHFADNNLQAAFWFGHAETVAPLLSLMNLKGCNAPLASIDGVASQWKDYDVIPLAAYINIIICKAPSGSLYAMLEVNGKMQKTPMKWEFLRQDWLNRLAETQR